jgi:HK97 family phage major capsid protein
VSKDTTRKIQSGLIYRTFEFNRAELKDEERTVELSFSSETPVEQYNWDIGRYHEILDHSPSSVDLSRLNNSAPLLMDHNRTDQVGVIESSEIRDGKGYATVRFGKSERASEIFQDVKDGIRRLVSVGYRVSKLVTEKIENEVETLRAMRWLPMEISIVSIPADTSVGIGRQDKTDLQTIEINTPMKFRNIPKILLDKEPIDGGNGNPPAHVPDPNADKVSRDQMIGELGDMFVMAKRHGKLDLYEKAIAEKWDRRKLSDSILAALESKPIAGRPVVTEIEGSGTREGNQGNRILTIGERFVASDAIKQFTKGSGKRSSALNLDNVIGFRQEMEMARATLLTTGLTSYQRPPGIVLQEQQPLTIAQLFSQGETTAPTIRIFKETSYTNAATAVAEEGQKPEATFALEEADFAVRKIAVVGRVSDEMLSDFPAVRDYINARLGFMVQSKEDSELLNGDGTSNRITGVLNTGSIQTEAAAASATTIDAVHKALTKVRTVGFFEPDAIVMNPLDWQTIRLSKDSNGQYYAGGPFSGPYGVGGYSVAGFLWGKPVIETTAISQGTALAGAFRIGGQIFRRMGLTMEMTNSDASDFQYNRIAIRAEERLALVIYRPLAFATITGIPA